MWNPFNKKKKDYSQQSNEFNFIRREGSMLMDGNSVFRWVSYNVPNLLLLEDRPPCLYGFPVCRREVSKPAVDSNGYSYGLEEGKSCIVPKNERIDGSQWVIPNPWEQEDAIQSVSAVAGRVIRTYTLAVGPTYHICGIRTYFEPAFVAIDNALAIARKHRIRLMIPIINNHWGGDSNKSMAFGDYGAFAALRGLPPSAFFTNCTIRDDFKHLIGFLLNRVNSVNSIRYCNDECILGWQLGNELGGWDESPPPAQWTLEMASLIKQLAPNTLVIDGMMGGLDAPSRFDKSLLNSPLVDVFSCHYYYGLSDLFRVKRDAKYVHGFAKGFVCDEFGLCTTSTIESLVNSIMPESSHVSGVNLWSLRYHSEFGGFYRHFEKDSHWSYHVPGFPAVTGFVKDERRIVQFMRKCALKIAGLPSSLPYPVPNAPSIATLNTTPITPLAIRFRGSAAAAYYKIYRSQDDKATWKLLSGQVYDNVGWSDAIYCDETSSKGIEYFYKVEAVSLDGAVSNDCLILGPLMII